MNIIYSTKTLLAFIILFGAILGVSYLILKNCGVKEKLAIRSGQFGSIILFSYVILGITSKEFVGDQGPGALLATIIAFF